MPAIQHGHAPSHDGLTTHFEHAPWNQPDWHRLGPAERLYVECLAAAPAADALSGVIDELRRRSLIGAATKLTVEAPTSVIQNLVAAQTPSVDRVVLNLSPGERAEQLIATLRCSGIQFSVTMEVGGEKQDVPHRLDEVLSMYQDVSRMHLSVGIPETDSDSDIRRAAQHLETTVARLEQLGIRRLSRVTFGRPRNASPSMAHVRSGGEYLGIGPGAASMRLADHHIARWRQTDQVGHPEADGSRRRGHAEQLSVSEHLRELIMLQLPSNVGLRLGDIQRRGIGGVQSHRGVRRTLDRMLRRGEVCSYAPDIFRPTPAGWRRIDRLIMALWSAIE
jgi:hypothetical protein